MPLFKSVVLILSRHISSYSTSPIITHSLIINRVLIYDGGNFETLRCLGQNYVVGDVGVLGYRVVLT